LVASVAGPQDAEQSLLKADARRLHRIHPCAQGDQVAHQVGYRRSLIGGQRHGEPVVDPFDDSCGGQALLSGRGEVGELQADFSPTE